MTLFLLSALIYVSAPPQKLKAPIAVPPGQIIATSLLLGDTMLTLLYKIQFYIPITKTMGPSSLIISTVTLDRPYRPTHDFFTLVNLTSEYTVL